MARRKFNREFKLSAVQLVIVQDHSIPEAARRLGVDPNCVLFWGGDCGRKRRSAFDG